jgi:phage tail sheath protein FI
MPVTTSYPGIYIEELPSNAHSVTAAPTSIAVFVGYTHPFKTETFGQPVELFSFTDYENDFGGLYASGDVQNHVAYAVNQFFLNGGSHAYVVGLKAEYLDSGGSALGDIEPATAQIGNIVFSAREPTDLTQMTVTVDNLKAGGGGSNLNVADVTITYGARVETYRGITIDSSDAVNYIEARIGTAAKPVSSLVTVKPSGANYGVAIPAASPGSTVAQNSPATFTATVPAGFTTTFAPSQFSDVFQADGSLDKLHIFNLIVIPGVSDTGIWSAALAFAERRRAFVILDPPVGDVVDDPTNTLTTIKKDVEDNGIFPPSTNGGLYFPWLKALDPLSGGPMELPPSGYVAGIFARTDTNRGVWKAPAGLETVLLGTAGGVVDRGKMTDAQQGTLNPIGVNVLRTFPGVGTVVFGARTLVTANSALEQWWYVPVRRMALFIEDSLYDSLGWAIFEPNAEPLWVALTTTVTDFMLSLFRQGAFKGTTPSQAFQVKCDASTTTQTDIDQGIVNIVVAFAPLKPAEFVVIKIAQLAGQAQS